MKTKGALLVFEIVSLVIQLFCIFLTLVKAKYVDIPKLRAVANVGMWVLFALFLLNTIGNLFAESSFETLAFTPVTALLSFLVLRLALEK